MSLGRAGLGWPSVPDRGASPDQPTPTEESTALPPANPSHAIELPPAYPDRAAWGTAGSLRAWQAEAIESYFERSPRDFLAVATPGAGKTTFALTVAAELLARRVVDRITVVAPTVHLKVQWAAAAQRGRLRLRLRPGARRPCRAAGAVPGVQRADAVAHPRRRRGRRTARRAADQGPDRPGAAYRAGPRGILDAVGPDRGRQAAL